MSLLVNETPLENHIADHGLLVKREDLSCPPPGPPFSKMRGVVSHVAARAREGVSLFGVLDTTHSQAGHAVALAAHHCGARVLNFYPVRKSERGAELRPFQARAAALGAEPRPLAAGRSAILFHQARKVTEGLGGYMMPNALKLPETVEETAAEVGRTFEGNAHITGLGLMPWIVSASSGTIAAGVLRGLYEHSSGGDPRLVVHMGYDRSPDAVLSYLAKASGVGSIAVQRAVTLVNEGYSYAEEAWPGDWARPSWPCNPWYDLKAFRWWSREGRKALGLAVFWNIG